MITKVLLAAVIILVIFAIIVALRPPDFRVTQSAVIASSPSEVYPEINDLRHYAVWNPFGKMDPDMKMSFDGPPAGPGCAFNWAGNSQVGEGRLTITDSRPNEAVIMRLEFIKPFPSTATADFHLEPRGSQTLVTWTITGRHAFVHKAIGLFVDMDKMIGGEFAKGLAELKSIVEAPKTASAR